MSIRASVVPKRALTLLLALLVTAGALMVAGPSTPAEASSNKVYCLYGYNYKNASTNYVFAASDLDPFVMPEPCAWSTVRVYNYGCGGQLLGTADGGMGWTASVAVTLDSSQWQSLCSFHGASYSWAPPTIWFYLAI